MNSTVSNALQIVAFTVILLGIFFFQDDVRNMLTTSKGETEQENRVITNEEMTYDVATSTTQAEPLTSTEANNTNTSCDILTCFSQKFARCEPGEFQSTEAFGASAYYKIIGAASGGCSMEFKYPKNPNPNWVNKEMTCVFDNKIDFEKSVQTTIENVMSGEKICSGPLYSILSSLTQKLSSESTAAPSVSAKNETTKEPGLSASFNNESDTLTLVGTNLLDESGEISLSYFIDPTSVVPTLKSEMVYAGVTNYSKSDPNPFITVTDTQILIKTYASVTYCRGVVKDVPEFENSGKRLKVGLGIYKDGTSSSVTPDVTFEVECRDTTRKLQEVMSM